MDMRDNSWSFYGNDTGLCLFLRFFKKPCRLLHLWLRRPALRPHHRGSSFVVERLVRENGNNAGPPLAAGLREACHHSLLILTTLHVRLVVSPYHQPPPS